jgi:hypothetical protein
LLYSGNTLTPLQQYTTIVTGGAPTAFNFAGATCTTSDTSSTGYTNTTYWNVDSVALIVYYTGTAVPLSTALNITTPLSLNSATNTLGFDPSVLVGFFTPASSSDVCSVPQTAYDASFAYFCTATNTWKRVALSTF